MKKLILSICLLFALSSMAQQPIDRKKVVERNNPHVTTMDSLNSLSVGNGGFAMTVDGTGLQSFPKSYSHGVPLGTMSDWGWHSFANPEQGGRIKMRSPPKVLTGNFRPSQLSFFLS